MINQFHKRRIIMVYNFTVSEIFVKQNIKKAFNPCFNPSEDEYSDYLTEILEVIYEDVSGDDANE